MRKVSVQWCPAWSHTLNLLITSPIIYPLRNHAILLGRHSLIHSLTDRSLWGMAFSCSALPVPSISCHFIYLYVILPQPQLGVIKPLSFRFPWYGMTSIVPSTTDSASFPSLSCTTCPKYWNWTSAMQLKIIVLVQCLTHSVQTHTLVHWSFHDNPIFSPVRHFEWFYLVPVKLLDCPVSTPYKKIAEITVFFIFVFHWQVGSINSIS